jgi:hypothetical protein
VLCTTNILDAVAFPLSVGVLCTTSIRAKMDYIRPSLGTSFFYGIFIFSKENKLIFFRKIKFFWENVVPKLALRLKIRKVSAEVTL